MSISPRWSKLWTNIITSDNRIFLHVSDMIRGLMYYKCCVCSGPRGRVASDVYPDEKTWTGETSSWERRREILEQWWITFPISHTSTNIQTQEVHITYLSKCRIVHVEKHACIQPFYMYSLGSTLCQMSSFWHISSQPISFNMNI